MKFICVMELHSHTHCALCMFVTSVGCKVENRSLGKRKLLENNMKI